MDKDLIRQRFAKAADTYMAEATVQCEMAARVLQLVGEYCDDASHGRVLEVGSGTGAFTWQYLKQYDPGELWINDLCGEVERCYAPVLGERVHFISGDAESIGLPRDLSLIVSCSTFQWFNSQEDFFRRCLTLLDDGAYLVFTTFGKQNMREVAAATGFSLPYRSLHQLQAALLSDYDILYSNEEIVRLEFDTPLDALRHLKRTGVTGTGTRPWTRRDLDSFCRRYDNGERTADGRVGLTYHPIYFVTRKRKKQ